MEILLTAADAGRLLGVTPAAIRQMERRGLLRVATRTERGIRLFRRGDVEALARERARQTATGLR